MGASHMSGPLFVAGGIFSQGVPTLAGSGAPLTSGSYIWLGSTAAGASDSNDGLTPQTACLTLNGAVGKCTADTGDVILAMPGHAEAVTTTSHTLSKAGVTVWGLGAGLKRPTFTYGAAAATINVTADNVTVAGCRFVANFLNVASAFTTAAAKEFTVKNCDFTDNTLSLNFLCNVTTSAVDNAADGLAFVGNYVYSLPTTDGACVSVLANLLRLNVSNNIVDKAATSDAGHLITMSSKVCGGVRIVGNRLTMAALSNQSTGTLFTGSSTTSSGICADNYVAQVDTSAGIIATTGTKISFIQNFMSGAADKSGTLIPAADDPT